MNILITGGAGFIGSNLANSLITRGYDVSILDNLDPQIHGENPLNSYTYKSLDDGILKKKADLTDFNSIEDEVVNKEIVVHLASQTGTGQSMYQVNKYMDVNVTGTVNLFEAIKKNNVKVKKFILASSRSVYGEGKYFCTEHGFVYPETRKQEHLMDRDFECKCPVCEKSVKCFLTDESSNTNPVSLYALTKLMQENIVKYYCGLLQIPYVIFRMQNIYGEGQSLNNPYTGIISIFSSLLAGNKNIDIFEDGAESRDFLYIRDVVRAYVKAIETNSGDNQIINLGSGKRTSVIKLANDLRSLISSDSEIKVTGQFRIGDIRHNVADMFNTKKYLDYSPEYSLGEGLRNFVDWKNSEGTKNIGYEESLNILKENNLLVSPKPKINYFETEVPAPAYAG